MIKIIGAIGNNPRKDRDGFRVLHRGGMVCSIAITYTFRTTLGYEEV